MSSKPTNATASAVRAPRSSAGTADIFFSIAIAALLYLRFFHWPTVPIDPASADQAVYLWGATNILDGKVIYRDFYQFSTPGTEYLYALLIKLFGHTASLPKFVTVAVAVAVSALGVKISRFALSGWKVYLPSLLFLTAGFLPLPDATHHVFSTLAALVGLIVILESRDASLGRAWPPFFAGICAGISFCFTHSRGVVLIPAFAIIYLLLAQREKKWRAPVLVIMGALVTIVAFLGPVILAAGVENAWRDLIRFPFFHHRNSPWNNLGAYGTDAPPVSLNASGLLGLLRWLLVYLVSPGICLVAAVRLWRMPCSAESIRLWAILITGTALFVSIAYAPTHFRMGMVSLPAFILLIWLLDSERSALANALTMFLAIFAVVSLPAGIIHSQGGGLAILQTPSGKIAASPPVAASTREKYDWLSHHTLPGDYFFTPDVSDYEYLFRLKHAGPASSMWVGDYSTSEQVRDTVEAIRSKRVPWIIWPVDFQTSDTTDAVNNLRPLEIYLRDNYTLDKTFGDGDQLWKRKQ